MRAGRFAWWILCVVGCGGAEATPSAGIVDSIVQPDTAIARFQRAHPRVHALAGGASSREALVGTFVGALERRDTTTLQSLLLSASEFGWLYYPGHPEGLPPYRLTPQLMWFMLQGSGAKGYQKLLVTRSGKPLGYAGHRCEGEPGRYNRNIVWGPCVVLRRLDTGDTVPERLFGQIVERDGRYKFVSYANKL